MLSYDYSEIPEGIFDVIFTEYGTKTFLIYLNSRTTLIYLSAYYKRQ